MVSFLMVLLATFSASSHADLRCHMTREASLSLELKTQVQAVVSKKLHVDSISDVNENRYNDGTRTYDVMAHFSDKSGGRYQLNCKYSTDGLCVSLSHCKRS